MEIIEGSVRYKRGRKQKDGSRIYIIRYSTGLEDKEIRIKEEIDTDASFHSKDSIEIINPRNGTGLITIKNLNLETSITGNRVF